MLSALVVVTVVAAVHRPALDLALMGDDYQWVQHARAALRSPSLLVADLDTFYRPASTWTLAADAAVWGGRAGGYHLTNLLLHVGAALMLLVVGRRLGLPPLPAALVALLWATSPYSGEPAYSVAIRFQNLLFLAWLALVAAWPSADETWTPRRRAAVVAATLLAAASKETWVVTPGLVAVLELWRRRTGLRRALTTAAVATVPVVVYLAVYFAAFPGSKGYFDDTLAPLAKIPHEMAVFMGLETLQPAGFRLTLAGAAAVVLVAAAAAVLLSRVRSAAAAVGVALLLLPTVPTLLVPFLPTRYTAIPWAGFLLVAAAAAVALYRASTAAAVRIAVVAGSCGLVLAVLASGVVLLRADLADMERVSRAHERLLAEAAAVAPLLPVGEPILFVRAEDENPLGEVAASVEGLPKAFYVRADDPYGLVDAAALLDFVCGGGAVDWRPAADQGVDQPGPPSALLHREGTFILVPLEPDSAPDWTRSPVLVLRPDAACQGVGTV